jgi:hypothetical protein
MPDWLPGNRNKAAGIELQQRVFLSKPSLVNRSTLSIQLLR